MATHPASATRSPACAPPRPLCARRPTACHVPASRTPDRDEEMSAFPEGLPHLLTAPESSRGSVELGWKALTGRGMVTPWEPGQRPRQCLVRVARLVCACDPASRRPGFSLTQPPGLSNPDARSPGSSATRRPDSRCPGLPDVSAFLPSHPALLSLSASPEASQDADSRGVARSGRSGGFGGCRHLRNGGRPLGVPGVREWSLRVVGAG
jgi:hypothetical protein